jgi:hypothetical protein
MGTKQKVIDMGNGLVETEYKPPAVVANSPMAILAQAVQAGTPASELTQLMDLAERYEANQAAAAYGAAITRFQSACPIVHKSRGTKESGAFGYTYASYDDVMRAAGPALRDCGLAINFSSEHVADGIKVTCRIRHGSHYEDHTLTVPVPSMKVNDTQKYGAALSYAKRYALCAALNIVVSDEDDDAAQLNDAICEADVEIIRSLLMQTNSDGKRFLKWAGVERIEDMSVGKFREAVKMLEAKPRA